MKIVQRVAAVTWVVLWACTAFAGELSVVGTLAESPSDDLNAGFGGEIQYRHPIQGDVYALGLAGVTYFGMDSQYQEWRNKCFKISDELDGNVRDISFGVGLGIQKPLPWWGLKGRLDGDVSWHQLDSDVKETWTLSTKWHSCSFTQKYGLDDTFTAGLNASVVKPITDKIGIVVGGGYRFDLDEQKFDDTDEDFDLTGAVGFAGIKLQL